MNLIGKILFLSIVLFLITGCGSNQNNTNKNTPTPPTTAAINQEKTFLLAEVQTANNTDKCWSIIDNKIYDLTSYINKHPHGAKDILSICGQDGSQAFSRKHSGKAGIAKILETFQIGTLK